VGSDVLRNEGHLENVLLEKCEFVEYAEIASLEWVECNFLCGNYSSDLERSSFTLYLFSETFMAFVADNNTFSDVSYYAGCRCFRKI
jgi:hypothetical protein